MTAAVEKNLSGWGRYPVERCLILRPESRRELRASLSEGEGRSFIARGLGRSYGDSALNGLMTPAGAAVRSRRVVAFERLNRFLAFDPETGVLECEAGVSLEEIIRFFLPRGFFPLVTPGTRFVTVGGAIAHDVHGKNHHRDGTFSRSVLELRLLTAGGETLTCSPEQNPEAFWATVGGAGLTGLILSARLQLRRVESAYLRADFRRCAGLDAALAALQDADAKFQYSVAWVDCLARGRSLGRGVLICGNHAARGDLPKEVREPLAAPRRRGKSIPLDFPSWTLNRHSVRAFNILYYALHPDASGRLMDYESFFHPLDAISNWNRIYGSRGFVQYQAVLPPDGRAGLVELLERLSRSARASFLAVLKRSGPAGQGMLSFPREGFTLALDLPAGGGIREFLAELDRVVLKHGGRLYLAKDAVMSPEAFAEMYPRLAGFREAKARLDPAGRFSSSQARRLHIAEEKD